MESTKVKTTGKPRTRPLEVLADSAYDDKQIRKYLRQRAFKSNIPVNIRNQKNPKRGRTTRFEYDSYRKRGAIERFFAWLKMGFRRITSRYERLNVVFKGLLDIACFMLCWKSIKETF
jgi:transposase